MSFALKLWKIGNVISKNDVKSSLEKHLIGDKIFFNINFEIGDNDINITTSRKANDNLYCGYKVGGSGSGIYYLYPNLEIRKGKDKKDIAEKKIKQLRNTLMYEYELTGNDNIKKILDIDNWIDLTELNNIINSLKKDELCLLYFTINGKSFDEAYPEIFEKWYDSPFRNVSTFMGYDYFTNEYTEIGYNPDIKIFSYDNYDTKMRDRLFKLVPLSLESAKTIKFAWLYICNKLIFGYNNLEYIILPDSLEGKSLKHIIKILSASDKYEKLNFLASQENKIIKKHNYTLDYFFIDYNKTNNSFKIYDTINDLLPSQITRVANSMKKNDLTESKLSYVFKQIQMNRKNKGLKNKIIMENIYYAKLLLSNVVIDIDDLLRRFNLNCEYDLQSGKKRLIKDEKKQHWINNPLFFSIYEQNVYKFLKEIDKIRE